MLPDPQKFTSIDLTRLEGWPAQPPIPAAKLLKRAGAIQSLLAPSPRGRPFFIVAGVRQDTVVGIRTTAGEFQYEVSAEGDGTVPLSFAELPGARMFYIEESHGSLPNNGAVCGAVCDLLSSGETSRLPLSRPAPQRARKLIGESDLRRQLDEMYRSPALSQREKRMLVCELASPEARTSAMPLPAAGTPAAILTEPRFDQIVIGRRRQHRLDLRLVCGNITDVDSRAWVLGIFRDVTPSGAARAIDARIEGAITEFTNRRMFSGNVGEIFMMPAGRHPIRTDTILFVGLGLFDSFNDHVQELAAENVIRTLIRTRVEEFATVFLGAGSGRSTGATLENMMKGFLRGLRDVDGDRRFRSITLCEIDRGRFAEVRSELYRLLSTPLFEDVEVTLDEQLIEPVPETGIISQRGAAPLSDPVYLLVRRDNMNADTSITFRASVLTAGPKATVVTSAMDIDTALLDKHLAKLQSPRLDLKALAGFGEALGEMTLSKDVITLLRTMRDRHLVVVHDASASRIPWETLLIKQTGNAVWEPALAAGLSRRYTAENLSIAKWLDERRRDRALHVLLVVNPTGDLPAAEAEGRRIQALSKEYPSVELTVVRQAAATRTSLLRLFQSGDFDVLHYAGHAFFDPDSPSRSGIICAGSQVLSGRELAGIGSLPGLVFFNACEAGRIRRQVKKDLERSVGLAEAFLRGGVANYVGTYWPVGDESASIFAETFYRELLKGGAIGDALLLARRDVKQLGSVDWADYIHYGDFRFVLKL
jgi:hypothetical protein